MKRLDFFIGVAPDSLTVIPTIVITRNPEEWILQIDFLMFTVGAEVA